MKARRTGTVHAEPPTSPPTSAAWERSYPDLTVFADSPELPQGADPADWTCQALTVSGGFIRIGKAYVEVAKPIRFTFAATFGQLLIGDIRIGGGEGESLRVRGGLLGLAFADRFISKIPLAQIYVQAHKTGIIKPGPGFRSYVSGIKVRMRIPLLGRECHIGTDEAPVILTLTSYSTDPPFPNKPISGKEVACTDNGFDGGEIVDNAFSVPAIRGPGRRSLSRRIFDRVANTRAGLPAAGGHNTLLFTGVSLRVINYDVLEEARREIAEIESAENSM